MIFIQQPQHYESSPKKKKVRKSSKQITEWSVKGNNQKEENMPEEN